MLMCTNEACMVKCPGKPTAAAAAAGTILSTSMGANRDHDVTLSELSTSCAKLLVGKLPIILTVAEGGTKLLLGRL
jgi:type III secretory pathway component EscT